MRTRTTPRQKVADHLLHLGYGLNDDDIKHVHGGIHKVLNDTLECWSVFALNVATGKTTYIVSGHTLTECAKGIELVPNTPESDLYGDLLAIPIKH